MSRLKTYRVRFSVRDCYTIDVVAVSADAAIAEAHDRYERFGESSEHGIDFDISDGGTMDWDAEEVVS